MVNGGSAQPGGQRPDRLARAARSDRHLLARSSITLISRGFSKFAQILFLVIAARLLSVEEFACYSYLLVLAAAFTILSDTGVPLVAGRDASAGQALSPASSSASALPIVVVTVAAGRGPPSGLRARSTPAREARSCPCCSPPLFVVFNRLFDLICDDAAGRRPVQARGRAPVRRRGRLHRGSHRGDRGGLWDHGRDGRLLRQGAALVHRRLRGHPRGPAPPPGGAAPVGLAPPAPGSAFAWRWPGSRSHWPCGSRSPCSGTREASPRSPSSQRLSASATALTCSRSPAGSPCCPGIAYLAQADPPRARRLLRRVLITVAAGSAALSAVSIPSRRTDHAAWSSVATSPAVTTSSGSSWRGLPAYTTLGVCWYAVVAFDGEARLFAVGLASLLVCVLLSALADPVGG